MAADSQEQVLALCVDLDTVAFQLYDSFARSEVDSAIRKQWEALGRDEAAHIAYWRTLIRHHRDGVVPRVFDEPTAVLRRLEQAGRNIHALMAVAAGETDNQERLTVACLMELTFLDPALLQALRYVSLDPQAAEQPLDAYNRHLGVFLETVSRHGVSPELRLLAEALQRLWGGTRALVERTHTDPLTGLLNRRGLRDTALPLANLAKRSGATIAVAMADIDHFKRVNDSYGHEVGDRVLVSTAAIVRRTVRSSDVVGRFGGEEFVVFLPEVDPSHLFDIGEKIRREVEANPVGEVAVTVSVGLAAATTSREADAAGAFEELVRRADANLYRAKGEGRNRVVV